MVDGSWRLCVCMEALQNGSLLEQLAPHATHNVQVLSRVPSNLSPRPSDILPIQNTSHVHNFLQQLPPQ